MKHICLLPDREADFFSPWKQSNKKRGHKRGPFLFIYCKAVSL